MNRLKYLITAVVGVVAILVPATALAINYGGIGGRPAYPNPNNARTQSIFIFELKPGQQASNAVLVLNNTNQAQTINLDSVDSELASGGNFTCRQAVEPKLDVGAWITLSSTNVTIAPFSNQVVPFTVMVPNSHSISVGEHDGCITIQAVSQTAKPSNTSGIVLSFRSAIRVVVTVPGKIIKKLSVLNVAVGTKSGNYIVSPVIKNEGNVSLDAYQTIRLVSIFGFSVTSSKEGSTPVLPQSIASQEYTLKKPFWGGLYRARDVVSYNNDPSTQLGEGRTVNQTIITKNSALFYAWPAPLGLLIEVIVLIFLIYLIFQFVRKRNHRQDVKQKWESYKVNDKDTLQSLAHERSSSWKLIAKTNKLKPPYHVEKGSSLKLPPKKK